MRRAAGNPAKSLISGEFSQRRTRETVHIAFAFMNEETGMRFPLLVCVGVMLGLASAGCARGTGEISPELTRRFAAEGIVRRADDAAFRYTAGAGRRGGSWDE